ncbi:MAG: hypothetical protein RI953_155 [Pseudomonadota bacterium]
MGCQVILPKSRVLLLLCIFLLLGVPSLVATAQRLGERQAAQDGIYSLVEVNPADLMWGRYRVAQESFLFESVSFAWNGEFQEARQKGRYREQNFGAGISLQYYPQSVTLQGPFLRAESNLAVSGVLEDAQAKASSAKTNLAVLKMAGDLGWRVRLSERLTGSAAYGLRTTIPQVLWTDDTTLSKRWLESGDSLDVRVQINLGLLL